MRPDSLSRHQAGILRIAFEDSDAESFIIHFSAGSNGVIRFCFDPGSLPNNHWSRVPVARHSAALHSQ